MRENRKPVVEDPSGLGLVYHFSKNKITCLKKRAGNHGHGSFFTTPNKKFALDFGRCSLDIIRQKYLPEEFYLYSFKIIGNPKMFNPTLEEHYFDFLEKVKFISSFKEKIDIAMKNLA